jgi:hypothetical protein
VKENRHVKFRAVAVLVVALFPAGAFAQPASLAARGPIELSGSVGHAYDRPLRVVVFDEWGSEMPDVVVSFTAPVSGPSASFSPSPAVTDESGEASVTATANGTIGVYTVTAAVAGVSETVTFTLYNVAAGFRPGEQLASVFGADEKNRIHNIRDFLDGGKSYALIEVCSFCPACLYSETETPIAIARLADRKISVNLVPVLFQGGTEIASATEAQYWKSSLGLKVPVLHASGSPTSEIYQASWYIMGLPAFIPTTLLVAPDGTIVDRLVGAGDARAFEERVLRAVLAEHPVQAATAAAVVVAMDRRSLRGTAAPTLTGPLGSATFTSRIRELLAEDVEFAFDPAGPLSDSVHVELSPRWTDGVERFQAGPVYANYRSVLGDTPIDLRGWIDVATPVSKRNGTFVADFDVKAHRAALAAALAQLVPGYITQEQADAIVRNINSISFELPLAIDLRLTGSAR